MSAPLAASFSTLLSLTLLLGSAASNEPVTTVAPSAAGMSAKRLAAIDEVVEEGIGRGQLPGCVVVVGRGDKLVMLKAFGHRRLQPGKEPMTTDTVFDLASLTKPLATACCVMKLVEQGRLNVDDPVSKHLPEFAAGGKQKITVGQLLTHQGGLTPDNPLRDYDMGADEAMRRVYALQPIVQPGTKFVYSDVGFIVLGELVQRLADANLHEFSRRSLFRPLGMSETGFLPAESLRARAATTQQREERWMRGEVHDPRAYRLGGVAGHAGLFSTPTDLARFAQMLLGQGVRGDTRVLMPSTVAQMTKPVKVSSGLRGLGWDIRTGYSSNRGDLFSPLAFGHGGFTGTTFWVDPGNDLFVIFLSNRVHPDGKGSVNRLAGRIGTIAAAAILP